MRIVSLPFVLFTVFSVAAFYLLNPKYRIAFLVLLSCFFLISYNYLILLYVLLFATVNFYIGRNIEFARDRKMIFRIGILFNIIQILLFKYLSFTIEPIFTLFNFESHFSEKLSSIFIPLGISFFTLQGIGYLINIYKGWEKSEKNFFHFFLFVAYYPKFLSGPIERSNKFLPQLNNLGSFNQTDVSLGLRTVLFGFFKKVVIADQLGLFVTHSYENIDISSSLLLWFVLFIQPLYLYFDFSGYTDIALGFSRAFGIFLSPNFNKPFFSENMTSFWKRFHISLSSWFNDYLFRQICYKYRRWGNYASSFAVFVTFTLFGIWHGAGWNFMVLGFLQALAINYEFFTKRIRIKVFANLGNQIRKWLSRLITYCFYGFTLIFFFSSDLANSFNFLSMLFGQHGEFNLGIPKSEFMFAMCLVGIVMIYELINNDYPDKLGSIEHLWYRNRFIRIIVYNIIGLLVIYYSSINIPFVYQQF